MQCAARYFFLPLAAAPLSPASLASALACCQLPTDFLTAGSRETDGDHRGMRQLEGYASWQPQGEASTLLHLPLPLRFPGPESHSQQSSPGAPWRPPPCASSGRPSASCCPWRQLCPRAARDSRSVCTSHAPRAPARARARRVPRHATHEALAWFLARSRSRWSPRVMVVGCREMLGSIR
jgi:hypothetical protein